MDDDWLDGFASALGERPIEREEMGVMLRLSRDVAHRVERRFAPLSTYLAGLHVGRRVAEGASPGEALREVREAAASSVPEEPEDDGDTDRTEGPASR